MQHAKSQSYSIVDEERLLPITLVKEYYWCPMIAYHKLLLWSERPTQSMQSGGLTGEQRAELVERLEEARIEVQELLWEQPVQSRRLGLVGRVDLVAVTPRETLVVVEAKLSVSRRSLYSRAQHILAQLAAYTIAAEETLAMPSEKTLVYATEAARLIEVRITPRHRRLVEEAARELWRILETGITPWTRPRRSRCRACSYRGVCPSIQA
ncbi:CRISPR-associated protein Cas4 [Pyrodictium delaneyi]|uniref:CRISPR-associated protein Cas4 n=1 Tax=Pyrodictium delaneyi TaxID=1273541 RepID=UPI00117A25C8|nr:CRISPR-associated protein Cas4 [Pyrodictium delaneyi]